MIQEYYQEQNSFCIKKIMCKYMSLILMLIYIDIENI